MALKYQYDEPEEGQMTLGFVIHVVKMKEVLELFPDLRIQGWVIDDGKDEEDNAWDGYGNN